MFDRLDDLLIRYEEVMGELQEPDVANDPERFRRLIIIRMDTFAHDFHLSIFKLLINFSKQLSNCTTDFFVLQYFFR